MSRLCGLLACWLGVQLVLGPVVFGLVLGPAHAQPALEAHLDAPDGGLSGLVVHPDGSGFFAVNDRGFLVETPMVRDDQGRLTGLGDPRSMRLLPPTVEWPDNFYHTDAEGLAMLPDGRLAVAFEGLHRVSIHNQEGGFEIWVDVPDFFDPLTVNAGPEAVAVAPDGTLFVLPEDWPPDRHRRPIFAAQIDPDGDQWSIAGWMPAAQGFDPVGLDMDAEGRLYVLERRFRVGFASRIRRLTLGPQGLISDEILWQSRSGQFGNLEGLALWLRADGALIATLVGDDNFNRIQRRDLIELRLSEEP